MPDLAGYTDHQLIALIIVVWLTTMGGLVTLAIRQHSTAKDAKAAKDQTVGTGNGFAAQVKEDLRDIKKSTARLEHRLDEHMNNHDRRNARA